MRNQALSVLAASLLLMTPVLVLAQDPLADPLDTAAEDEWSLDDLGPSAFELGADLKLLGIGYDLPEPLLGEPSYEWSSFSSLRCKLEGSPRSWLDYELHLQVQHDHFSSLTLAALSGATETSTTLFRGFDLEHSFSESANGRLWAEVDYANLRLSHKRADLVIGRQAVTFGRSFFWSPSDWLSTFSPTEIDREYKGGIDAARLSLGLGRFSGIELLYAYGEDGAWDESALMARAYANWGGWDVELLGGHVWIDTRLGIAFSGDVGGAGLRGELSWFDPRLATSDTGDCDSFFRATIEADYRWESSLQLIVELHHNGFGSNDPDEYAGLLRSQRLLSGQVSNVGRSYLGSQLSYELTPLLTGTVALLVNLDDGSGIVNPSIQLSLADESELVVGAIVPWGRGAATRDPQPGSEYGSYFTALWAQWRWTF